MSLGSIHIVKESLGPRVASELRDAIVVGDLAAGKRLIEADLAERYGVSRGPIRDAFKILQAEGLVEPVRQGFVVKGIGPDDISELYSLRGAIESLALRILMDRADQSWIASLETFVSAMQAAADAGDRERFGKADIEFHNAICVLSGHKRLKDIWELYEEITMTLLRLTVFLDHDLQASAVKHRHLLDVIRQGDKALAEDELARHLDGSQNRMVQVWEKALLRRSPDRAE